MDGKELFEKYYNRIAKEGVLKAVICGLIVGFAVNFAVAFITWFVPFNGLWISIGLGIMSAAVSMPLFYYKLFRPTAKKIARRIDKLGLEERLITMCELEGDNSYMAIRQREDAMEKLAQVKEETIKFRVSKVAIASAVILAALGIAMTTVTALSAKGKLPDGGIIGDLFPERPEYLSVSYMADEGGIIEGESDQLLLYGEDASPVLAVADDGWMFVEWSDGQINPARADKDIKGDIELFAVFERVEEASADSSTAGDDGDSDEAEDLPSNEQSGGNPSEDPSEGSAGAGGRYEDNNQIEDGETYYRDKYEEYYRAAMEKLARGEQLTAEERAFIEAYLNMIR